jgi:hypothetical protein
VLLADNDKVLFIVLGFDHLGEDRSFTFRFFRTGLKIRKPPGRPSL